MTRIGSRISRNGLVLVLILTLLLPLAPMNSINTNTVAQASTDATPTINIGDYIQFGSYNDAPILWRVIHKDENGDPVLLSDRILSVKAYDSANSDPSKRTTRRDETGSSYYPDSNIRQWLNSSSSNTGEDKIDWIQYTPDRGNVAADYIHYRNEKGFLADGNFTSVERGLIKPLQHNVILSVMDANKKDGGTANHTYNSTLSELVQNYDVDAYYKKVTDHVFFLSVKQLKEWVYDNATILGTDYHMAKPTPQAVAKFSSNTSTSNYFRYWLNTPYSGSVRQVTHEGKVRDGSLPYSIGGVRPAVQLNLSSVIFASGGTGSAQAPLVVTGSKTVNVGDYIQFGTYQNAPILWRVVNHDSQGYPILLSDKILTFKAFDAKGGKYISLNLKNHGNSYYPVSTLRQWLNSSSLNMGASTIDWIKNDPTAENMRHGQNPYSTEKGFLADGNFTAAERTAIKPLSHKILLTSASAKHQADGGTEDHVYKLKLSESVQNYDSNAYYEHVTDHVFLPSVKQLKEWVFDNRPILGDYYHLAKPTTQAAANQSSGASASKRWHYWLNTPASINNYLVRYVDDDGFKSIEIDRELGFADPWHEHDVGIRYPYDDSTGVRPAMQIYLSSLNFASGGTGSAANPFVVSGTNPPDTQSPSAPSNLTASNITMNDVTLTWTASTDDVGVQAYDVYQGATLIKTITGEGASPPATSVTVTGQSAGNSYTMTVKAKDARGNHSAASNAVNVTMISPETTLNIGDYIQFGKYNNVPIKWRVINKNEKGDPVLLADRILSIKAFDAPSNRDRNDNTRNKYGSIYYPTSNLRQWLNSSEQSVRWLSDVKKPRNINLSGFTNGYDQEKGFLADGNFTNAERGLIKPITHKIALSGIDAAHKDGGTTELSSNYDTTVYHKYVTDRVFLLSVKQLKEWVINQEAILGVNYRKATPTAEAISNSPFVKMVDGISLSTELAFPYWLNTPYESKYLLGVSQHGNNLTRYPNQHLGLRPALELELSSVQFATGGTGSAENPFVVAGSKKKVSVGDYIQFGSYQSAPIMWRVIHLDANGDPVLLADKILTYKAFDAKGAYHTRKSDYGSNYYPDSNLRQWLNSNSPNNGANLIDWIQNDPTATNVSNGYNPYHNEKGFLSDGNFSAVERDAIKSFQHKVLLAPLDAKFKDSGTDNHVYHSLLTESVQNYDTSANAKQVTDLVFLPSVKQLYEWVYSNPVFHGLKFHLTQPTPQALKQAHPNSSTNSRYWLNTPYTEHNYTMRVADADVVSALHGYTPSASFSNAFESSVGVRPALQLNLSAVTFLADGEGVATNPFVVSGGYFTEKQPPSTPSNLVAVSNNYQSIQLTWSASTDNFGVTGYDVYRGPMKIATVTGTGGAMPATSYNVTGLSPGTNYTFEVRARDAAGNVSDASNAFTASTDSQNTPTVNVGDYIRFGSYFNAPILWRVIHKDPNGNPVLFSDRILSFKAFDAKGSYHNGNMSRRDGGSNYYPDSNLRQWLNSSSPNSGTNTLDWIQNDPRAENMLDYSNGYHTEKGFLANGNFTADERQWILPFTHKVIIPGVDAAKKDGGTTNHINNTALANVVQNYDTTAYYKNVTDQVFLLSVKQLKEWVFDQVEALGPNYQLAKPTLQAMTNGAYQDPELIGEPVHHLYWLNTPNAGSPIWMRASTESSVQGYSPNFEIVGVRPALLFHLSAANFVQGDGTSSKPFIFASDTINYAPTNISLSINEVSENSASGTTVGTLSATDPDVGDQTTFTLVGGTGDTDNASFVIEGTTLKTAVSFDYEAKSSYSIRVQVRDGSLLTYDKIFTIHVTNVNEDVAPTDILLATDSVFENSPIDTTVSTLNAIDANPSDTFTYSLVSGTGSDDNASFNISGDQLRTSAVFNSEAKSIYSIRVKVTDGAGFSKEKKFEIFVTDVAETVQVELDAQGGVDAPTSTTKLVGATYGAGIDGLVADLLPVPARTNYTFLGWYTTNSVSGSMVQNTTVVSNEATHTLYAHWKLNTYNLTFSGNGETSGSTSNSLSQNHGTMTILPGVGSLARKGFTFAGWNSAADGSGTTYAAGATYTFLSQETLYALWIANSFTLTYRGNGHTRGTVPARVTQNENTVITIPGAGALVKTGFVFVGWNTVADGSGIYYVANSSLIMTENLTLHAQWTRSGQDTLAPSVPKKLVATNLSQTELTLNWEASTDNRGVTAYEVYNGKVLLAANVSGTSYLVSGLSANTKYLFTVRAKDAAGNKSLATAPLSISTSAEPVIDAVAPTVPTAIRVSGKTVTGFTLSWTASTDRGGSGLGGYEVYLNGAQQPVQTLTTNKVDINTLKPLETVTITVLAFDLAGNKSALSSSFSAAAAADNSAPSVPVGLNHSVIRHDQFRLTWNPSTDNVGVAGYNVYSQIGNEASKLVCNSAVTYCDVTGLSEGMIYKMTVKAFDDAGKLSAASVVYNASTYLDREKPSIPTGLEVSKLTSNSLTIAWNPAIDNNKVAGYHIYLLSETEEPDERIGSSVGATYRLVNLKPATTLKLFVKAFDAAGPVANVSDASDVIEITTLIDSEAPTAPDNLQANQVVSTNFQFKWDASTDDNAVSHYEIYRNGTLLNNNHVGTSLFIDELTPKTTYRMGVRAVDTLGNRSEMSEILLVSTNAVGESGPVLSEVKMNTIVDKSAMVSYVLNTDAYMIVRVIDATNQVVAVGVNQIWTKAGSRILEIKTASLKDGKYRLQMIASDGTSDKQTTLIRGLTIKHVKPIITGQAASALTQPGTSSTIKYTLTDRAFVTVRIYDSKKKLVRTLTNAELQNAGVATATWNGRDELNQFVPDGLYTITYDVVDLTKLNATQMKVTMLVDWSVPVISNHSATPNRVQKVSKMSIEIKYTLSENAKVTLKIMNEDDSATVKILLNQVSKSAGQNTFVWDGKNAAGQTITAGMYKYTIEVVDVAGKTAGGAAGAIFVTN